MDTGRSIRRFCGSWRRRLRQRVWVDAVPPLLFLTLIWIFWLRMRDPGRFLPSHPQTAVRSRTTPAALPGGDGRTRLTTQGGRIRLTDRPDSHLRTDRPDSRLRAGGLTAVLSDTVSRSVLTLQLLAVTHVFCVCFLLWIIHITKAENYVLNHDCILGLNRA